MNTVKMLKHDALIPIKFGTGFVQRLQSMMMSLASQRTEEEIQLFQKLLKEGQELPEAWMEHIETLSILLKEIDQSAEANGFIIEKSIDDLINEQGS